MIWKTPVDWLPETPRIVCSGVSNKGAAILNGKLYRTTLDAHVIALDMKTGITMTLHLASLANPPLIS